VVLGIPPTRPETGYGYIERAKPAEQAAGVPVYEVKRFTEKPQETTACEFVATGNYYWNAGMFFWRAATFLDCLQRFLPATHQALARVADTIGTRRYAVALARAYPKLENISVDYAILERATREPAAAGGGNVFVLPAEVGWSDIGSWAAVYDLAAGPAPGANVSNASLCAIDSSGNYAWSAKKLVALLGVSDLVVVETPDALLICPRNRAQDVGRIVKWLEANKPRELL
jgi:mannose-1-phosphate guanylyltransferase